MGKSQQGEGEGREFSDCLNRSVGTGDSEGLLVFGLQTLTEQEAISTEKGREEERRL